MTDKADIEALLRIYDDAGHELETFMDGVVRYIGKHPRLNEPSNPVVHSYKSRLKNRDHLRDKLVRKRSQGREINAENFFWEVTDLAGVRILHLFQESFAEIDTVIRNRVSGGDWYLSERPRAYTWDPEAVQFFSGFDLDVSEKATSYTSVHYVIRPRQDSSICCEVQVRTLFEEIWGEVDHQLNYPTPTDSIACREQLKVLSKIVGAGSRLLDSLRRVHRADRDFLLPEAPVGPGYLGRDG